MIIVGCCKVEGRGLEEFRVHERIKEEGMRRNAQDCGVSRAVGGITSKKEQDLDTGMQFSSWKVRKDEVLSESVACLCSKERTSYF